MQGDQKKIGKAWLTSQERKEFNATISRILRWPATILIGQTLHALEPYGYSLFTQSRIGKNGSLFKMLKIQTLPSKHEDHEAVMHQTMPLVPAAQLARDLAIDEYVQIFHVSENPQEQGEMMVIGSRRPQLKAELVIRERELRRAGYKDLARQYMRIQEATEPAIFAPESFAKMYHKPATLPYYKFCAESTIWHYNNASQEIDTTLFVGIVAAGDSILQSKL